MTQIDWPDFARAPDVCLPAIAQDAETGEVLLLAYMNAEAFRVTMERGQAVYFSRSRNRLCRKGEQSGHTQRVDAAYRDADPNLLKVRRERRGYDGYRSCFLRQLTPSSRASHSAVSVGSCRRLQSLRMNSVARTVFRS
jgi:phosphoribosyl-AMP cyclohydrolase